MVARFFLFIFCLAAIAVGLFYLVSWLPRLWCGKLNIWKNAKEKETNKKLKKYSKKRK